MESYFKISSITGEKYDLFKVVRILNIQQVCFYLDKGVKLLHIEPSEDRKTQKPLLVFFFDRDESKDAYDEWCNRKDGNK